MKKLLLILLCLPMIGFGQTDIRQIKEKIPVNADYDYCDYSYKNRFKNRNIYIVLVNRNNNLLVEGEYMDISQLREGAKAFIDNNGENPKLSENQNQPFSK